MNIAAIDVIESLRAVEQEEGPEALLYVAWHAAKRAGDTDLSFDEWATELPAGDIAGVVTAVTKEMTPTADDPTGAS